jgi:sensor histidine kinase YesM
LDTFFAFIKKRYTNIWIRNGILISLLIFFNLMSNSTQPVQEKNNPFAFVISIALNFLFAFVHNHILLRRFLFEKKIIKYILLFIVFVIATALLVMYITPFILSKPYRTNIPQILLGVVSDTMMLSIFYFLHFYFLKYIKMNEIQILNQKTEIENLKQQLNPHFLLNSLNNLYGVSLSNPTEVPSKIIELTDLLKYQIETSKKDYNSLVDEKSFIEKYIAYSKWKLQNITINSTEVGEMKNYKVTPMVFLPLVENAIKYSNFEKNPIIKLQWTFSDAKFIFTIINSFKDNQSQIFSTKSGLKNLTKRLELFHPDSKLEIEEKNNNFTVSVTIWNLTILA